jgi:molybdenum cofactor cytidylyltransferase
MIAAVVLAAGLSRRMGSPKLVLPWGATTVIGRVVQVLRSGGADEVVVVTGGHHDLVEQALRGDPARIVFNPDYEQGEMLSSLQAGMAALSETVEAALVALGDQPQIEGWVIRQVLTVYRRSGAGIVVPSYQMRRGHPWLTARRLWPELFSLCQPLTLRDFLRAQAGEIVYETVDTPTILSDLDTPDDYRRERPS